MAQAPSLDKKTLLKGIALIFLLVCVIAGLQHPLVRQFLDVDAIQAQVETVGIWGPLLSVAFYVLACTLFIPASILGAVGVVAFGPWLAFLYIMVGATIGSATAFSVARYLGRDFARHLVKHRLDKYDQKIKRNGFATIFYLRVAMFPFFILNFGAGLTSVRFRDYLLATILGIIPGTVIVIFFVDRLVRITHWSMLLTWDVALAIGLVVLSLFIPRIMRRLFPQFDERE
jgi:uncharacterized membrane protein YdjX (TVP38/TMEM64 family)